MKQFRGHLESLFKSYHDILSILPNFFSEQGDMSISNANRFKVKKTKSVGQHFGDRRRGKSMDSSDDDYDTKLAQSVSQPPVSALAYANTLPTQLARVIPPELRNFPKFEVSFFLDKITKVVEPPAHRKEFLKLLDLYS